MLYGAMNFPVKPVFDELEAISELGFDYLELAMDPPQAHYSIIRQQKKRLLLKRLKLGRAQENRTPRMVHQRNCFGDT
jgi:Tat protein secretion system quality control protein TatD with DNase activity